MPLLAHGFYLPVDVAIQLANEVGCIVVGHGIRMRSAKALEPAPHDFNAGVAGGFNHQTPLPGLSEIEPEHATTLGGGQLGRHAVTWQSDAEIVGPIDAGRQVVIGRAVAGFERQRSGLRHDRELAIIAHPRAGLMRGTEADNRSSRILKEPPLVDARLWAPIGHAPGRAYQGQRVPVAEGDRRIGSLQGIDVLQ